MDCPSVKIHEIKCPTHINDFTVGTLQMCINVWWGNLLYACYLFISNKCGPLVYDFGQTGDLLSLKAGL